MNVGDERSHSLWMDVDVAPGTSKLTQDAECDTVVVGSGIAGLSTAYELSGQGQKVVVLDRGMIGRGMTARTTAHLSANNDDTFKTMIDRRGEKLAQRLLCQSGRLDHAHRDDSDRQSASIATFGALTGSSFPGRRPSNRKSRRNTKPHKRQECRCTTPRVSRSRDTRARARCAIRTRRRSIRPSICRVSFAASKQRGGRLFADTAVMSVEEEDGSVVVKTEGGQTIRAKNAVVATNSPINDRVALHSKQAPYRTYAMALQLPRGKLPDALYWDTLDPYHYVRLHPGKDFDYLIAGGADHKSGEADDAEVRYEAIEAWIRNLVPDLGEVTHRWSGQVLDTIDYSAFSGRNPGSKNVYVHTGDSGQGMTHGVVGSLIIARMIMQGEDLWQELYGPERKTASALSTFISENVTDDQESRRIRGAWRGRFIRRDRARSRRDRPAGPEEGCGISRRGRRNPCILSRLHASRLPPALEFVRAVLGLPVPRVAVQHRRRSAERASNSSAPRGGGRLQRRCAASFQKPVDADRDCAAPCARASGLSNSKTITRMNAVSASQWLRCRNKVRDR